MKNQNNNREDLNRAIIMLFVLFIAIVLQDITTGTLNLTWAILMGSIIIGLALSASSFSNQQGGDVLKDP